MLNLDIVKIGNPVLTTECKEVEKITDNIITTVNNMKGILLKNRGLGLAANQIGILKRIIVVLYKGNVIEMINPKILESSGMVVSEEGCLSIPDKGVRIMRNANIKVSYLDINGEEHTKNYNKQISNVIQHEIDHLNGILITKRERMNQL